MTVDTSTTPTSNPLAIFVAIWGIGGVVALLTKSMVSLGTIALEPIVAGDLLWWHWVIWTVWVAFMLYSEGYKGFHKAFAPRVVARALYLGKNPVWWHVLLAPAFCMSFFHATRKRLIVSYCLVAMIIFFVILIRLLPYPWRGLLDGGVVLGLFAGTCSIGFYAFKAWRQGSLDVSPEVPTP